MTLTPTTWYLARRTGIRRSRPFVIRGLQVLTPDNTPADMSDLDSHGGSRVGRIVYDVAGVRYACPPGHHFVGGLLSLTEHRLQVRYFPGFRDPARGTGLIVRNVTVETVQAIDPSVRTAEDLARWLQELPA